MANTIKNEKTKMANVSLTYNFTLTNINKIYIQKEAINEAEA